MPGPWGTAPSSLQAGIRPGCWVLPPPLLLLGWTLALAAGCGHSSMREAHRQILEWDAQLSGRLGKAKQADLLSSMGEPTARELIGEAEVWVYQVGTDNRPISPEMKAVAPMHDELILTFDREGTLQRYTVIIEGRSTKRERGR